MTHRGGPAFLFFSPYAHHLCSRINDRQGDAVAAGTAQVESLAFLQIGPVAAVRIGQVVSIALAARKSSNGVQSPRHAKGTFVEMMDVPFCLSSLSLERWPPQQPIPSLRPFG
jgi:hypothetical protein